MLKILRQRHIAKIIFWGLVILIMPAFVFWGTGSIGRSKEKGPSYVGIINKKKVSFENLYESMAGIRSQVILNYFNQPEMLDALLKNKPFMAKAAWDRLIMLAELKNYGIKVPDEKVISYIRTHPLFIRNGSFDPKIYEYALRYNMGLSPRSFEENIRKNMAIQELKEAITKNIGVTDDEILKAYKKENEKFKISYILIDTESLAAKVDIADNTVKDYYEKHKNEFLLPSGEEGDKEVRFADFDDVKNSIRSYLAHEEAKGMAFRNAKELHKNIIDLMEKDNISFEDAIIKLGLKTREAGPFSSSDYLEGIGEARPVAEAASELADGRKAVSAPIAVRSGAIIFRLVERTLIDETKYKDEKEKFGAKVLEEKKTRVMDEWFTLRASKAVLVIDLKDIEDYYR